jgi:hypothetical protein
MEKSGFALRLRNVQIVNPVLLLLCRVCRTFGVMEWRNSVWPGFGGGPSQYWGFTPSSSCSGLPHHPLKAKLRLSPCPWVCPGAGHPSCDIGPHVGHKVGLIWQPGLASAVQFGLPLLVRAFEHTTEVVEEQCSGGN